MIAFGFLVLLMPLLAGAVILFAAWREGRHSPFAFGIGRVLSNSFTAIGGAPLAFLAVAVLLSAIPGAFVISQLTTMTTMTDQSPQAIEAMAGQWTTTYGGIFLVRLLLWPLGQALLTLLALDTLAGRSPDVRAAAGRALRLWPFAIALVILTWIGIFLGFMLLVVPGVVLFLNWFVTLPVLAAERRGILASFGRSTDLLRGMRWRLAALLLLVLVLWLVATMVGGVLQGVVAGTNPWLVIAAGIVGNTLWGMILPAGIAAVYHEARVAKEGSAGEALADVFA
ncbi:hypothetical protein [Sphingomonas sp. Leaf25]|uniref:hypothetical protein n=1 Tax=Sphingomonas sp. Leaf25 TaxID=1735692 RepID=UPI0006FDD86A|nr:hypothetical protein [Sphingomonas sp. Leaf25]KQM97542.1 hypothetical protein ASE78_09115 [Sphingomonas sp. Leaf25]